MTPDVTTSLTSATSVAIYLPPDPSFPLVAAGLGVYLSLKSRGTSVDIVCPTPMTVAMNRLVGVDQIKTELPGRNLVISFDYVKDAIEKVSYNVENGKFNLLVQPKAGHQPLSADNVGFKLAGNSPDLVVLVGNASIPLPADLPAKASATAGASAKADDTGPKLPTLSLVPNDSHPLAAETAAMIQTANLPLDQDIAGNLLQGLADETGRFNTATADDFSAAANLTRHGGSLNQTLASSAGSIKPDSEIQPSQWTGPKIFHSGDVI